MRWLSRGALEFRTKPSDFGRIGGKIRLLAEKKQCHTLYMGIEETMVASQCGYSRELFNISRRVFSSPYIEIKEHSYILDDLLPVKAIRNTTMAEAYKEVMVHYGSLDGYTRVKWRESGDWYFSVDCEEYAKRIMFYSGREKVPAKTFLLKKEGGMTEMFVRTALLESFPMGRNILNYVWLSERLRSKCRVRNNLEKRLNEYIKNYDRV